MGVTGIIMMMGNIKVIMKILILVDEITELMMIETVIAQEVMIRSNISNMRCSVSSPDERPRRELKIRRAAEYF